MTDRELMQQALEAFEWNYNTDLDNIPACEQWAKMLKENITALRAALAEPEQEPVAWMESPHGAIRANPLYKVSAPQSVAWSIPLYTAPTPRKPLTDEDIFDGAMATLIRMRKDEWKATDQDIIEFARAIEKAHGIGEQT